MVKELAVHVQQWEIQSMLAIRLDTETEKRLESLARKTGRTKTFYAREAILQHLEDLEDIFLAEKRLRSPGRTYSAAEVKRELDLSI
jgi:RHH-type transcriptional regulator, rel operon repressor / antitoxin RelB